MIRAAVWDWVARAAESERAVHGMRSNTETVFDQPESMRADDGNRTRMTSLEGWGSTIELHPRGSPVDERHQ